MGNVNFEFLDQTPIENVITCLNYRFEKVVFFGYQEVIDTERNKITSFLKGYCGVTNVVYLAVPRDDLNSIINIMSKEIEQEIQLGSNLYFDVTGGEDLVLFAFGKLSEEYTMPIHKYDIANGKLIELDIDRSKSLSTVLQENAIHMTLDMYVKLQGGIINYTMHKDIKSNSSEEFESDIAKMWQVATHHWDDWNRFSHFIRSNMMLDSNLQVNMRKSLIQNPSTPAPINIEELETLINELANVGLIEHVNLNQRDFSFRFKNEMIKECLWESGSILELHTYQHEKLVSDDCMIGVHIDWDGIIHEGIGKDVLNEIDVLSLSGYVLKFISCKTGRMESGQALHALYELQTVADRFGSKYAKKVLITAKPLARAYMERAKEMGIEVR